MADPRYSTRDTTIDMGLGFGSGVLTAVRDASPFLAVAGVTDPAIRRATWRRREGLPIAVPDVVPDTIATAAWFAEQSGRAPEGSAERARYWAYNGSLKQELDRAGAAYEPQTRAGRWAKTAGEFAPNAIGGPATAAVRVARVAVPTVLAEGSRELTEHLGGGERTQEAVKAVAGLVGDVAGHKVSFRRPPPAVKPSAGGPARPIVLPDEATFRRSMKELRQTFIDEARKAREREQELWMRRATSGLLAAQGVADALLGKRDEPRR